MTRLRVDSRDKHFYQMFGQVDFFEDEFIVKESMPDFLQPVGDVKCTCITCCDIASDKDDILYDIDDLFNRIPHNQWGANPRDALGETIKNGLLLKGGQQRVKTFSSYWICTTGNYDAFDNVRSALKLANYPIATWTYWYDNWYADILPIGLNNMSGHMYTIEGWKQVNGEPMLVIEAWQGKKKYMPRATFNDAVSKWGCGSAVLSTSEIDTQRKKSIMESIIDACQNVIILLNQLILQKKSLWKK